MTNNVARAVQDTKGSVVSGITTALDDKRENSTQFS